MRKNDAGVTSLTDYVTVLGLGGGDKKTKIRETPTGSARRGERCEGGGGEGGEDCNATPAESDGYNVITTTGNLPVPRAPEIVDEVGAG